MPREQMQVVPLSNLLETMIATAACDCDVGSMAWVQ